MGFGIVESRFLRVGPPRGSANGFGDEFMFPSFEAGID